MKQPQSTGIGIGLALLACLLCGFAYSLWQLPFIAESAYFDQRSYLVEAQRLLEGAAPYGPQLAESNPPFIIWFSTLSVVLARWTHGSPMFFLRLLTLTMIFGSVAWCVRLLRRRPVPGSATACYLLGFLIFVTEFALGTDFSQREHLLVLLLFPYAFGVATGAVKNLRPAERCALGVAAACAIWLKPQEAAIVAGLELFLLIRARGLRHLRSLECVSLIASAFFILLCVRLFAPLYFTAALPLLGKTFWGLGETSFLGVAMANSLDTLLALGLAVFCIVYRRTLRDPETPLALLTCSLFASLACDVQHTLWLYHRLPQRAFLQLAAFYVAVDLLQPLFADRRRLPSWVTANTVIAAVIVVAFLATNALDNLQPRRLRHPPPPSALDAFLSHMPSYTTVYILSTSTGPIGAVHAQNLRWGGRFAHLWMLPAIIQNERAPTGPPVPFKRLSPETTATLADQQRTELADDLGRWQPASVLVQQCTLAAPCQGLMGKDFDMAAWFLQAPAFAAQWAHYRKQAPIQGWDVYTRIPDAAQHGFPIKSMRHDSYP